MRYKRAAILDCFLSESIGRSPGCLEFIRRAEPSMGLMRPARRAGNQQASKGNGHEQERGADQYNRTIEMHAGVPGS